MIYYSTPYSLSKNIGEYYNDFMELLPNDDDWACFTDGDSMFTVHDFGHIIQENIDRYPEANLWTCLTNRVGTTYQCVQDVWEIQSVEDHWKLGEYLKTADLIPDDITDETPLSGVLILIQKKWWKKAGGFHSEGMLGVDNSIHRGVKASGGKVYMMKNLYMLHYYRNGDPANKSHLL